MLVKVKNAKGEIVEMDASLAAQLGLVPIVDTKTSDGFYPRPAPRDRLAESNAEHGTFTDFTPANLVQKYVRMSKNGNPVVSVSEKVDATKKHRFLFEQVSFLQEQNPHLKILVGDNGDIAPVGNPCRINEEVLIGRTTQLVLG